MIRRDILLLLGIAAGFCLSLPQPTQAMTEIATVAISTSDATPLGHGAVLMDSNRQFVYVANTSIPAALLKIRLSDYTTTQILAFNSNDGAVFDGDIDSNNAFAYLAMFGKVVKVNLNTMTRAGEVVGTLPPNYHIRVDSAGVNGYVTSDAPLGGIMKLQLSDMTIIRTLQPVPNLFQMYRIVLSTSTGFGYFDGRKNGATSGEIAKIRLSDLSVERILPNLSWLVSRAAFLDEANGFAYFAGGVRVSRIRLSDFTLDQEISLTTSTAYNVRGIRSGVIDTNHTYAYFGVDGDIPLSGGRVEQGSLIRLRLSDLKVEARAAVTDIPTWAIAIDSARNFVYAIVNFLNPDKLSKISLLDITSGQPEPPRITIQPQSSSVKVGSSATFSVKAEGTAPFSYQWQREGVDIPGATQDSYTTGALAIADDGTGFRCIITNSEGSVRSDSVRITVLPVIKIFPNPWRADRHTGSNIFFEGAPPNSRIKIFTLSMHWVKTLEGSGTIPWDLKNNSGESVASGYYFYVLTTPNDRQTVHGKFAVIK